MPDRGMQMSASMPEPMNGRSGSATGYGPGAEYAVGGGGGTRTSGYYAGGPGTRTEPQSNRYSPDMPPYGPAETQSER
jgi:hypothetical protein